MLDSAGEGVHGNGFAVLRCIDCRLRSLRIIPVPLQSRNFNDFAAKLTGKLGNIDFVAVFAEQRPSC